MGVNKAPPDLLGGHRQYGLYLLNAIVQDLHFQKGGRRKTV